MSKTSIFINNCVIAGATIFLQTSCHLLRKLRRVSTTRHYSIEFLLTQKTQWREATNKLSSAVEDFAVDSTIAQSSFTYNLSTCV